MFRMWERKDRTRRLTNEKGCLLARRSLVTNGTEFRSTLESRHEGIQKVRAEICFNFCSSATSRTCQTKFPAGFGHVLPANVPNRPTVVTRLYQMKAPIVAEVAPQPIGMTTH